MASDSESKPSAIEIPAPEESDSAQVVSCLELAGELWKSGQHKEAIRFIQRGAAAAEEDGNDMRALKLARLGADLSAQVADAAPAAAAPAASGSNGAATKSLPSAPSARPHPANHPSVRVSQPPPLPGGSAAGQPTPSPPSVAPAAPSASADKEKAASADKEKAASADKAKDRDKDKDEEKDAVAAAPVAPSPPSASSSSSSSAGPASVRGSRTPAAERTSVKPSAPRTGALVASAPPKPSAPPTPNAATSSSVAELIASGLAERVSVKRSSLDASLLVVRPVSGNGAKPAHGARHAVLIYVDSDAEA